MWNKQEEHIINSRSIIQRFRLTIADIFFAIKMRVLCHGAFEIFVFKHHRMVSEHLFHEAICVALVLE